MPSLVCAVLHACCGHIICMSHACCMHVACMLLGRCRSYFASRSHDYRHVATNTVPGSCITLVCQQHSGMHGSPRRACRRPSSATRWYKLHKYVSTHMSVHMSVLMSVLMSVHMSTHMSKHMSMLMSTHMSMPAPAAVRVSIVWYGPMWRCPMAEHCMHVACRMPHVHVECMLHWLYGNFGAEFRIYNV